MRLSAAAAETPFGGAARPCGAGMPGHCQDDGVIA